MTNKEKLVRDLPLIAKNHGFNCNVEDFLNGEDNPCIFGGCNVPTLSDTQMLCQSVGIGSEQIESDWCGITIYIPQEWYENTMHQEWKPQYELWLRADQTTTKMAM